MVEQAKAAVKRFNMEAIGYMNDFEGFTRCKVRDCIITEEGLMFVVDAVYMGRVLGFKGENVRKIEARFKKKVRIIEFSQDVTRFVRNLLYPVKPRDVRLQDDKVIIEAGDTRDRGMIIGRDRKNLKRLQELVSRYFSCTIEVA